VAFKLGEVYRWHRYIFLLREKKSGLLSADILKMWKKNA
jgi:hypothetical protein